MHGAKSSAQYVNDPLCGVRASAWTVQEHIHGIAISDRVGEVCESVYVWQVNLIGYTWGKGIEEFGRIYQERPTTQCFYLGIT